MIQSYEKYATDKTASSAEELWDAVLHYDFATYDDDQIAIKRIWDRTPLSLSHYYLPSNGTTAGIPRNYAFGPNLQFWLDRLEWFIKFGTTTGKRPYVVYLQEAFPHSTQYPPSFQPKPGVIQDAFLSFDVTQKAKSLDLLKTTLNRVHGEQGRFHLIGQPTKYLQLFSDPDYRGIMLESQQKVHLVSSDWETLFPKVMDVKDQMINWTTMVNFYTCGHGTKHFLPLFLRHNNKLINLLNFATKSEHRIDDLVKIGSQRELCPCGRWYLPFEMVAHVSLAVGKDDVYYHDTALADSLESVYHVLQFIQNDDRIDVLYSHSGAFRDADFLTNYWEEKGYETVLRANRYLLAGTHKPLPFYKNRLLIQPRLHLPKGIHEA